MTELESKTHGYKCEKCGRYDPYFHGECFMYYDSPKICISCGEKMRLIEIGIENRGRRKGEEYG